VNYSHVELDPRGAHRQRNVRDLLDRCQTHDRRAPLGDHALSALVHGEPNAWALGVFDPSSHLVAYAQATPSSEPSPTWTVDIAIDPDRRDDHRLILDSALEAVLDRVRAQGGRAVQWWCHEPTDGDRATARRHGLVPQRQLLEMHRHLAAAPDPPLLETQSFVPGVDDADLLRLNNVAFAEHPDQGSWTPASLAGRFASDWFDPDGLLVHRNSLGTMLGFCWTKIHRMPAGSVGEIYVVALHPSARGQGLGRAITQAGVVSLHARGIDRVMLYVDGANTVARRLYQRLGFVVTSTTTALQHSLLPATTHSLHPTTDNAR
jgi:mycothiol synthase